jgi:transposase
MKPIPTEMRKRILDDCNDGMTEVAAAEKWKVSPSFITKLKRRVRDTGSLEPTKAKTGPKPKLQPHYELLQQIVAKTPDATIEEIREQLPVQVCPQTVANALIQLKLVYKKNN